MSINVRLFKCWNPLLTNKGNFNQFMVNYVDLMFSVDKNWAGLVQSLSGQFCSAINSVSEAESTNPELSFKPQGLWPEHEISSEKHLRYATIPRETVCTENLTPWKKLLPCGSSGGVC